MKVAILGAAGVRTPLIVRAFERRLSEVRVDELALMDIDGGRLSAVQELVRETGGIKLTFSTDARAALKDADFVITTFRVGGMESRVIDERVPLRYGVLGQETTGPGGFAMAMRTIPVLLGYLRQMEELCPRAWLLNFANPSGIMAETALRIAGWKRAVGICDAPSAMARVAAALAGVEFGQIYLDYFGLNHLGWIRAVIANQEDLLPGFLEWLREGLKLPGLPFSVELLDGMGMIPNEYLYYYYHAREAAYRIQQAEQTRGEYLCALNRELFSDLERLKGQPEALQARYRVYLQARGQSYMASETGIQHAADTIESEGYAGVALDIIAALSGGGPRHGVLNVRNAGAIHGMGAEDVVEVPVYLGDGLVRPLAVGEIPAHCLGLMQQVKTYERLTIEAAVEGSYAKALRALALHPLVGDEAVARRILEDYIREHGSYFPVLK